MKEPEYPEDFKGWKPLYTIRGNRYLILGSPDGSKEACIHLEDNDVVGIIDAATGEDLYVHPLNVRGALILLGLIKSHARARKS